MRWAAAKRKPQRGTAGRARSGRVWRGVLCKGKRVGAWRGMATAATAARRATAFPAALIEGSYGPAGLGEARMGKIRRGDARSGQARADLSTEPFGALCWALRNPDLAESGRHWFGTLRKGAAWSGCVDQGPDDGTEPFGVPCHPHGDGLGAVRLGWLRLNRQWSGTQRRGTLSADDLSTESR